MARDRSDKIPDLIRAAKKARDDHTALLLLQKAKEIDPANIEVYRLRAELFERRGDEERMLAELQAALEYDPTHWDIRYQLLNYEYPRNRNLPLAAGLVRDLIWQKRLPVALFNASRESLRSENELAYDEALLGHLAYPGEEGHGPIEPDAIEIAPGGDVLVLVSSEPWLLRFAPDGTIRFGVDLWLAEEKKGIERPADVAAAPDGGAIIADVYGRCLRSFDPEGRYRSTLAAAARLEPAAIAVAPPTGDVVVLDADGSGLRRLDAGGKVRGAGAPIVGPDGTPFPSARGFGLGVAPDGTAYIVDPGGTWVASYGPKAKRPDGHVALEAKAPPRSSPRGASRRGFAFDGGTGTLLLTDPARSVVTRFDAKSGRAIERLAPPAELRPLRRPRDVAATERGAELAIADSGSARVLYRDPAGKWTAPFDVPEPPEKP